MKKGFTLIETVITIFIFTLGLGGVAALVVNLYKSYNYAFQQSLAISEARRGLEAMVKEIREAKPGDNGAYIIEKADDYEFIFYGDIDRDLATERVRYFIEGTTFKKGVIEPQGTPKRYPLSSEKISVLTSYVRNMPPIFRYFDGSGNELPAPSRLKDTKLMKVYLVVNINPNQPPNDFTLESSTQLRNLKTNL